MEKKEHVENLKQPKKVKEEQALENRCPSCRASISFNPTAGKWKCSYCGSEFTLEEMKKYSDNASTKDDNKKESTKKDTFDGYVNYRCESCGAEIIADEQTAATFCVYCGNTAILKSKLSGEFSPDKIIPFKKEKEAAITAFKGLSKGRPLMPRNFNDTKNIEKIRGVYIPFWLYDLNASGDVTMNGEIVQTWTSGDTHYTKTDTFLVTRGGAMDFSNIPVDASTRFDNAIMNTIEPFDYSEMVPYNHAYLSGFYAEKYDETGDKVLEEATNRAHNTAKNVLMDDARMYGAKVITSDNLTVSEKSKAYAMLPVWMVNVKYNDKMHTFAMNGQTGEFIGNIPLDKGRTFLYTILVFIISLAICIGISYLVFIGGGN